MAGAGLVHGGSRTVEWLVHGWFIAGAWLAHCGNMALSLLMETGGSCRGSRRLSRAVVAAVSNTAGAWLSMAVALLAHVPALLVHCWNMTGAWLQHGCVIAVAWLVLIVEPKRVCLRR